MSCVFEGPNSEIPLGPSHNILHLVSEEEAAVEQPPEIDSLPSLEEFCKNTPVVNNIYNMLETTQNEGMLDFLNILEQNHSTLPDSHVSQQPDLPFVPENTQLAEFPLVYSSSLPQENAQPSDFNKIEVVSEDSFNQNDHVSSQVCDANQDYLNSFSETTAISAIETNNNQNYHVESGVVPETCTDIVKYVELAPASQQLEPLNSSTVNSTDSGFEGSDHQEPQMPMSETDIDNAMQSVLDHLGQLTQKEIQQRLDQEIVERCLEDIMNKNFHICGRCHSVFDSIPVFQMHIQTCIDPPRAELKSKMDASAMDGLARGLWKQVFQRELRKDPASTVFLKQHGQLENELDQIWEMSLLDTVVWCRQVFIKAAVEIVKRRWIATAYANEARHLANKNARKMKAPPRKRAKSEPSDEIQEVAPEPGPSSRKRGRPKKQPKSETEVALEGLIAEAGSSSPGTSQQFHFTPETPTSDFGFESGPASPVLSRRKPKPAASPENNAALDIDFEPEIDRIVRDGDVVNQEVVAAAAASFENLDERGNWESGPTGAGVGLGEDEFVVREILHRRLVNDQAGEMPSEEDFEYLVAWEGYGDDENTWEPYEHLKHCVEKLKIFHDSLKPKTQRKKKGKRH